MIHSGVRHSLALGHGPPSERRGFLPLLIAALAGGRALYGAINANQQSQRNKGYIDDNYRMASQKLDYEQAGARESSAESAAARGLTQGGDVNASPIATAMMGGVMKATGRGPTSVGGQVQSDEGVQMGLEQLDLENQHTRALKENKANLINSDIGAGLAGVQTAISGYGAAQDANVPGTIPGTPSATPATPAPGAPPTAAVSSYRSGIHAAMLSGASAFGVHPNDPLGESSSAWYTGPKGGGDVAPVSTRLPAPGEAMASFNTSP